MYTVGLISIYECCKTYSYDSLERAKNELASWRKIFLNNNVVTSSHTLIERDATDTVVSIKHYFRVKNSSEGYIMFLSKNR